jgi:hypothetical protein
MKIYQKPMICCLDTTPYRELCDTVKLSYRGKSNTDDHPADAKSTHWGFDEETYSRYDPWDDINQ